MNHKENLNNPLISIIVPAYNAEDTIEEAIYSVFNQTYKNYELILIDDCSNDNTYLLAKRIKKDIPQIRLLKNRRNLGVSVTRNIGISMAKGDWIAFLDSDDLWRNNKLEKQIQVIQMDSAPDIIFTGCSFINWRGLPSTYQLHVPQQITYGQLLKQNVISCSSVIVKKTLIEECQMNHDEMHEDFAVWLQLLRNGCHAFGIDEPLLVYRLSRSSKSSNKIKAARMTYKVYRYIGLKHIEALYYFIWYFLKNTRKYRLINKGFH